MTQVDSVAARLESEWNSIKSLATQSRFWTIEKITDQPDETGPVWKIIFEAPFVSKVTSASQWNREVAENQNSTNENTNEAIVELGDQLVALIEFCSRFPQQPPTIQLESPVFHPNIAADGVVNLADIGIVWNPEVSIDLVVERFWNVLRGSYLDLEHPINLGAGQWYREQKQITLPIDSRPLTEQTTVNRNIVSYRRKGELFRKQRPNHVRDSTNRTANHPIANESRASISDSDAIHFID